MADRYIRRLTRDIDRWIAAGLIPGASRAAILNDIAPAPARWSAQGAAALLGAVLLVMAALSFVAANWADLARAVRFAVIAGALTASYAGAAIAFLRRAPMIGHGLTVLGAGLFGVAIVLTAQTFNMSAFRNTAVLIWALGALVTGLAIPSRPVLILSVGLGGAWLIAEIFNPLAVGVVWMFAPLALVCVGAASWRRSASAMNLLAPALLIWIGHLAVQLAGREPPHALAAAAAFTLAAAATGLGAAWLRDRGRFGAGIVSAWAAAGAAAGLFALQPALQDSPDMAAPLAYLALAAPALIAGIGLAGLQVLARALDARAAAALVAAGAVALALPYLQTAGESVQAPLQIALGAVVFTAAAALILLGATPGRTLTGVIGVALFIAQSIYVYAELFGGLLGTAAFFFVGGVLLLALSMILTRVRARLARAHSQDGAPS